MISLKEAFKLCDIDDRNVVYFCDDPKNFIWAKPMTGKEVREKYDMKNTLVSKICPYFCMGEYEGFVFIIHMLPKGGITNE